MEAIFTIENFEEGGSNVEINSPRSLGKVLFQFLFFHNNMFTEACLRLGLDPIDLVRKPRRHYLSKELTQEMVDIKYNFFERKRQERISAVKKERASISKFSDKRGSTPSPLHVRNSTELNNTDKTTKEINRASQLLEMEARRLDALKRRQEKELSKIIEREQGLVELHSKVKRGEEEEYQRKKEHEKRVHLQHIEEEKKRLVRQEELKKIELEELKKRKDIQRREKEFEKKMKLIHSEEEKRIIKEAKERDLDRLRVIEENEKNLDDLINRQSQLAEKSRQIMIERENRVKEQFERKKILKTQEIESQKESAAKRIQEALVKHHEIQILKKQKYDIKQNENLLRNLEREKEEKDLIKKHIELRETKENGRIKRLIQSYRSRNEWRKSVVKQREDRDHGYDKIKADIDAKVGMLKFSMSLKMEDKVDNVERILRQKELNRLQVLKRIEDDDKNYENLMNEKNHMLSRHRDEMKLALIRKHQITDTMEEMRVTNDFTLLDKLFLKTGKKLRKRDDNDDDPRGHTA